MGAERQRECTPPREQEQTLAAEANGGARPAQIHGRRQTGGLEPTWLYERGRLFGVAPQFLRAGTGVSPDSKRG